MRPGHFFVSFLTKLGESSSQEFRLFLVFKENFIFRLCPFAPLAPGVGVGCAISAPERSGVTLFCYRCCVSSCIDNWLLLA